MKMTKREILRRVQPQLVDLERRRRQQSTGLQGTSGVAVTLGVMATVIFSSYIGMIVPWLIVGILVLYLEIKKFSKEKEITKSVGEIIMKTAHPEWSFQPDKQLYREDLSDPDLVPTLNTMDGCNLTTGKHGETEFAFSFYKSRTKDSFEKSFFTKLVLVFDFHKEIKGRTVVFPDRAQQVLGTHLGKEVQKMGWKDLELAYFEDPIFEKYFSVYTSDQVEARYVLTPTMMEALVKLKKKYNHKFSFSFTAGKVCVAISGIPDYFNRLDSVIVPDGALYHFYRPVEIAIDVIETMNLNTRIWSKE